jgi:hypothetical protein
MCPPRKSDSSFIISKKRSRSSSNNSKIFLAMPLVSIFINFLIFNKGEVPPHLHKLKGELERIYENLEKKNEMLMGAMMKNFGKT